MTNPTFGQALLAMIESDFVTVGGQPLINLISELQAAKGNRIAQLAAISQFVATAPGAGIALEIEVEQQLLQLALNNVQLFINAKIAAVPTNTPAVGASKT